MTAAEAFPLFDPEGEMRWAPNWRPVILHRQPDTWQDAIFTTDADGQETIWAVADYDAEALRVRYVRVTPGSRIAFVTVHCEAHQQDSVVVVTYEWTALSEAGEEIVESMTEESYQTYINEWRELILS